jgi:hypothetical protein
MKKLIALLSVLFAIFTAPAQQSITSPEATFGFKPGADRKLADWNELTAYQSEVTYKFLFNALLYSSSKTVSLRESSAPLPASGTAAVRRKGGD